MSTVLLSLAVLLILLAFFVFTPPRVLAGSIKTALPGGLILLGAGLSLFGKAGLGSMLFLVGIAMWRRLRGVGTFGSRRARQAEQQKSSVRAAAVEMALDHETGEMEGKILAGRFEGYSLSDLAEDELMTFRSEILNDADSLALLDAYLDRRVPGWREDADFDAGTGQGSPSGAGSMSEEEAYQVLGLPSDASSADIRIAHRRLMKGLHPDSGGSTFLATKINEAKDVLLRSHS